MSYMCACIDPVYSGKAMYRLLAGPPLTDSTGTPVNIAPEARILFLHTGGTFGLYDKATQMLPLLGEGRAGVSKMAVKKP